ncbi:hypothetical protein GALL_434450 [mine drainage metagenome]|uniref:Uncharacterized protein n=1 Tax=mine drainage metagenome TaxID=410659 RepID=A0A1J5PTF6_9ZZZZ
MRSGPSGSPSSPAEGAASPGWRCPASTGMTTSNASACTANRWLHCASPRTGTLVIHNCWRARVIAT